MKLTGIVKDGDRIEIPVYVNGSFAEKLILNGAELKRLLVLLEEPVKLPDGSVVIPATKTVVLDTAGTDGKNFDASSSNAKIDPSSVQSTPTAGDQANGLRKDPEMQAGDATAEKRGD